MSNDISENVVIFGDIFSIKKNVKIKDDERDIKNNSKSNTISIFSINLNMVPTPHINEDRRDRI